MKERLLIVGASVRPWVQSALAAGYGVCGFDFFADWDTNEFLKLTPSVSAFHRPAFHRPSSVQQMGGFQELFGDRRNESLIESCDAALICGGFETRIELVRQLESRIKILGPSSRQLERLRDSVTVMNLLSKNQISVPETKFQLAGGDSPTEWLKKRNGSSGGLGVQVATSADLDAAHEDFYFQELVSGNSVSGVFISDADDESGQITTRLIAVSRQIVGNELFNASSFQYCGSVGPVATPDSIATEIETSGICVGREFNLIGLWGIDFIETQFGVVPIDINPRLTASMELFEGLVRRADGRCRSMVDLHVQSCRRIIDSGELAALSYHAMQPISLCEGKAILFNRTSSHLRITPEILSRLSNEFHPEFFLSNQPGRSIADVPRHGYSIAPRHPVITLRVRMSDESDVWDELTAQASRIYSLLES